MAVRTAAAACLVLLTAVGTVPPSGYDSEGNLVGSFFGAGVAPPTRSHSAHLKCMTMYGGTPDQLHGIVEPPSQSAVACGCMGLF